VQENSGAFLGVVGRGGQPCTGLHLRCNTDRQCQSEAPRGDQSSARNFGLQGFDISYIVSWPSIRIHTLFNVLKSLPVQPACSKIIDSTFRLFSHPLNRLLVVFIETKAHNENKKNYKEEGERMVEAVLILYSYMVNPLHERFHHIYG
jgi:hypothetical protein